MAGERKVDAMMQVDDINRLQDLHGHYTDRR
jgi:hypothetical protein